MAEPVDVTGTGSLLVVDDDATIRVYLGRLLRRSGYTVRVAATVPTAVALMTESRPDLIITDLVTPHGGG